LTTAAVSAALVAGGVAGPATAADVVVPGAITIDAPAVVGITSYDKPATNVTIAGDGSYVHFWILQNGAWVETYKTFLTVAYGSPSATKPLDIVGAIQGGYTSASNPIAAGSYPFHLTVDANDTYTNGVSTSYSAAQTPDYTLNVSKVGTTITGFKTKTKVIKKGNYLSKKADIFTVNNGGAGAKVVFQYKKPGSKKWKNLASTTLTAGYNDGKFKDGYVYNQGLKGKSYPKGTQYFRVLVKETPFSTGAVSKKFKFKVK
jgi:hypothetical protein